MPFDEDGRWHPTSGGQEAPGEQVGHQRDQEPRSEPAAERPARAVGSLVDVQEFQAVQDVGPLAFAYATHLRARGSARGPGDAARAMRETHFVDRAMAAAREARPPAADRRN
jgi:hypothetical protein